MRYASSLRRAVYAAAILVAFLSQVTWALAQTTGSLSGSITDSNGAPVAGSHVTATAPSETTSTTTDGTGHFIFVSLPPDTYVVSAKKDGYDNVSQAGVTVFADNTIHVSLTQPKSLKTIASVTSLATAQLVKPSTTADVYSVNAATAARATALGGGGALNQAYSAVASVPGVYVPTGANGWNQTVLIRGGSYDQVGFEYDGVPVNRSFDNYPAHTASALGQQELEVYTGSGPANAESTGLAGFINQVIKTGTFPGFGEADIGVGSPAFYHKFAVQAGGANPTRTFTYYAGIGAYNQQFRYLDQFNGITQSALSLPGNVFNAEPCPGAGLGVDQNFVGCYAASGAFGDFGFVGPGGYVQGPFNLLLDASTENRENVLNVHFAIPHKQDSGRDDIQLLYDTSMLLTQIYDSANDWNIPGTPVFLNPPSSWQFSGATGQALADPATVASQVSPYLFPTLTPGSTTIPANRRGGFWNDDSIVKLQYQKNFGSTAYARLYGYTFYSDWLNTDPNTVSQSNFIGNGLTPEYELVTHTRGASFQFADQINPQNLINLQASTVKSTVNRFNNSSYLTAGRIFGLVVNSANPNNGVCYSAAGPGAAMPVDCFNSSATSVRLPGAATSGTSPSDPAFLAQFPDLTGSTCGGSPCELMGVENGLNGTLNGVSPTFNSYSLTDQYRPTDKWLINGGVRYETYSFDGANTNTGARPFWFAAYNAAHCVSPAAGSTPEYVPFTNAATASCPTGTVPTALANEPANYFYHEVLPRLAGTFTLSARDVFRFSYGRFAQPADTAAEQYNVVQQNLPAFLAQNFYQYGFLTPGHNIPPQTSNNYDLSWEHQLKGTDMSWKITPFWRQTQGEQSAFFINPLIAFVSNIPVGNYSARGFEFAFNKGDFSRNGLAGSLAFTYTYTTVKYTSLPNGGTPLSAINNDIATYNAFTSTCAANPSDKRCLLPNGSVPLDPATGSPIVASACYGSASSATPGAAMPCGPTTVANPYWNAPVENSFDLNGPYLPTNTVVSTTGLNANSYAVPYVATLLLNYRHDKWAITPSLQFAGGQRYGVPETTEGIDPSSGCGILGPLASNDPRYTGGTAGLSGNSYDATSCTSGLRAIPNPFTGRFDNIGAFVAPNQLLGNLLFTYDVSPKISVNLTLANLFVSCFGGTKEPWVGNATPRACSYISTAGAFVGNPVGNFYNPGAVVQPQWLYPYTPFFGPYNPNGGQANQPFQAFLDVRFKV